MTAFRNLDRNTDRPVCYRVDVAGLLDDHWSDWLGGVTLRRNDDATTTLTSQSVDQAQIHGLLAAVRDIGATLLAVRQTDCDAIGSTPSDGTVDQEPFLGRLLKTERLALRPARPDDADATWAYRRLDSVNEWLTGVPTTVEEYRKQFAEPSRLAATVMVELTDKPGSKDEAETVAMTPVVVGDFMLRRDDAWAQAEVVEQARGTQVELGWVLDPAHNGVGYATEAVRELLRYSFEDLGVRRVVANSFADNEASWRLMKRVGMRRETLAVAESLHRSGRWLDTVAYALLADEWAP